MGVLRGILAWVSLMIGSMMLVIAISSLLVINNGVSVTSGLAVFVIFGAISAVLILAAIGVFSKRSELPAEGSRKDTLLGKHMEKGE